MTGAGGDGDGLSTGGRSGRFSPGPRGEAFAFEGGGGRSIGCSFGFCGAAGRGAGGGRLGGGIVLTLRRLDVSGALGGGANAVGGGPCLGFVTRASEQFLLNVSFDLTVISLYQDHSHQTLQIPERAYIRREDIRVIPV